MTAPRTISHPQRQKLFAQFRDLGINDRELRLAVISGYLGRRLLSSNDLSADEAKLLIDWLDRRLVERIAS